jgi:hypothetical protein
MEDGVVAATKYIGINAPAAITASYDITFPAAVPSAQGHAAISTAGVVTWGQNVGTTGSPTFVRITSLSVATGTAPITVTSTTVCTNLNAGMVDGVHIATLSVGAIPYASTASNLAALAAVAAGSYLRSGGVVTAPLWSTLILPNAATAFRLPVATSANTIGELVAVGATGEYLKGNTGTIPSWATLNQAAVAGLTTADGPSFDHVHLTVAIGTAPLVVTSTTMVSNLNADLLDGNHAAAFATAGHDHDSAYISIIVTPAANHFPYQTAGGELIDSAYDAADFAASAHAHVQADITGLHTNDNVTFASLYLGVDDTARGVAHLYGPGAGYTYGGSIYLYLGADYDGTIDEFGMVTLEDDLLIGPNTDRDALKLDSNKDFYITAGSIILPASEYLNFGGVLGSGSYGLRDNAGAVEIKNSGGAWASPLTGVTVHNLLSATHGDTYVGVVEEGDIIYGISPLPGWPCRKLIALPIPTANLVDFPLKVPIIADADIGAACRADGFDIRFTAIDGITLLPYERESFAVADGKATGLFWAKSNATTAGTYIWCYYGCPTASDGEDAEAVWDADFKAVYHMNDATTSTILDSTANNNDGAKKGANEPIEADGKIGKGQAWDGYDDFIESPSYALSGTELTLEGWLKRNASGDAGFQILSDVGWSSTVGFLLLNRYETYPTLFHATGAEVYEDDGPDMFTTGVFVHFSIVIDYTGKTSKWYSNGSLLATHDLTAHPPLFPDTNRPKFIGTYGGVLTNCFDTFDEVRISSIARTAEWIAYEYANMNPADGGLTWGAEESGPLADSGIGTDAVALVTAKIGIADAGSGADIVSKLDARLTVLDSGSGADAIGMLFRVALQELLQGDDSISVTTLKLIQDAGLGTEYVFIDPIGAVICVAADVVPRERSVGVQPRKRTIDVVPRDRTADQTRRP